MGNEGKNKKISPSCDENFFIIAHGLPWESSTFPYVAFQINKSFMVYSFVIFQPNLCHTEVLSLHGFHFDLTAEVNEDGHCLIYMKVCFIKAISFFVKFFIKVDLIDL